MVQTEEREEDHDTSSTINVSSAPTHISDRETIQESTQKPVLVQAHAEAHAPLEIGSSTHLAQNQEWKADRLFITQGNLVTRSQTLPYALILVVDGTGGHRLTGHDACQLAIEAVTSHILPAVTAAEALTDDWNEQKLRAMVIESVQAANRAIFQGNQEKDAYMEVSLTVCFFLDATAYSASIGETRAYLYRQSSGLRSMKQKSRKDAEVHYLGEQAQVDVHPFLLPLQSGDKVLLCTDGLWKVVYDLVIEEVMNNFASNPTQMSNTLTQAALEGDGHDHIVVAIAQLNMVGMNARTAEKNSNPKTVS